MNPVTALLALAPLALTNSPGAWQCIGLHPKCSRKGKRSSQHPLTPFSQWGCALVSKHHLCAQPWQLCVSAGHLEHFGGGDTLLCLLAVPASTLLSISPLSHFLFLSLSSPFSSTPLIHTGITVLSHTRPYQAKEGRLWCAEVFLPGCRFWGWKPGPVSLEAEIPWCTSARTAHQQLPSSAERSTTSQLQLLPHLSVK